MAVGKRLFYIDSGANGMDLTPYIMVPTYKINENPVYEEWTDSNYTKHRNVVRTRVEGSFKVRFETLEEYHKFLRAVNPDRLHYGGEVLAILTVNNGEDFSHTKNTYVFMEFTVENNFPVMTTSINEGFEITITER